MTNSADRRPFSMPYVANAIVAGANTNANMVARAPWPQPVGKYFVLRKLVIAGLPANISGALLNIWDQDLSNTTPIGRGSAGGPLMVIPFVGVISGLSASMTVLDIDACPQQMFQAGLTVALQTSATVSGNLTVNAEMDVV